MKHKYSHEVCWITRAIDEDIKRYKLGTHISNRLFNFCRSKRHWGVVERNYERSIQERYARMVSRDPDWIIRRKHEQYVNRCNGRRYAMSTRFSIAMIRFIDIKKET